MNVKKWSELGFLDGIECENKKEILSSLYDDLVFKFVDCNLPPNFKGEETIIFPIIRRIIQRIDITKYNFALFNNLVREKLFEFHKNNDFSQEVFANGIDAEALLVDMFVKDFIENDICKLLK